VGTTARARAAKSIQAPTEPVEEDGWLESIETKFGQPVREGAEKVISWLRANDIKVEPTRSQDAFAAELVRADGRPTWPFFVRRSTGRLEFALGNLVSAPPYTSEETRKSLLDRIRAIPTGTLRVTNKLNGWPSISLEALLKDDVWATFQSIALEVKDAVVTQLKSSSILEADFQMPSAAPVSSIPA
jgi:hypothetical protein